MMHYPHVAHFATDEDALMRGIAEYLRSGLDAGGCCIVITSPSRWQTLQDLTDLRERTVWLNAEDLLPRLVKRGKIDAGAFHKLVGNTVADVIARNGARPVYGYGDLVGMLWERGEQNAAIHLEEYWNDLGAKYPFRLYCGYPIDGDMQNDVRVRAVTALHSHIVA